MGVETDGPETTFRAYAPVAGRPLARNLRSHQTPLRFDVTDRMRRHGRRIDAEATKIWASEKASETIREYVARTLGK